MTNPSGRGEATRSVVWTARGRRDLRSISEYDRAASKRLVNKLLEAAVKAGVLPNAGRMVPEVRRADVREKIVGRYRLMYWVHDERIEVLAVFEGHRRFPLDAVPDEE